MPGLGCSTLTTRAARSGVCGKRDLDKYPATGAMAGWWAIFRMTSLAVVEWSGVARRMPATWWAAATLSSWLIAVVGPVPLDESRHALFD